MPRKTDDPGGPWTPCGPAPSVKWLGQRAALGGMGEGAHDMARVRSRKIVTTLLAAAGLVVAAGAVAPPVQSKPTPTSGVATHIGLAVSTPDIALPNTPGTHGLVYVVAGHGFRVDLTFLDAGNAPAPLSTNQDVTVTLAFDSCTTAPVASVAVPQNDTTARVDGLTHAAANGLVVCAKSVTNPAKNAVTGTSAGFDVQRTLVQAGTGATLTQVGAHGDAGCVATVDEPVCADLLTPVTGGISDSAGILMSLGLCDGIANCKGSVVQTLVGLDPTKYTRTSPATLVMKCDKVLCGGGGINKVTLLVQIQPGSTYVTAPSCPAKGTVGPLQTFCVDYVQSTRDNSGDTYLYLLFTEDHKVIFP